MLILDNIHQLYIYSRGPINKLNYNSCHDLNGNEIITVFFNVTFSIQLSKSIIFYFYFFVITPWNKHIYINIDLNNM